MTGLPSPVASHFDELDSSDVRAALEAIASIVLDHGGAIHPEARFVNRCGDLSVHCIGGRDGEPLLRVPRELLIPVTGAIWADGTTMRLLAPPDGLTAIRRELLELHIALYNAVGKLEWAKRSLPMVALADRADLMRGIADLRPGFRPWGKTVAEAFLGCRVFGLPVAESASRPEGRASAVAGRPSGREPAGGSDRVPVLMPLIDTANHHVAGARFGVGPDGIHLAVARLAGSHECYARYGARRDALDLALHYGFLDSTVRVARSGHVRVTVPPVGTIEVGFQDHAPLHPLDPPRIARTGAGLLLSHLTFQADHPERLNATLGLAVRSAALAAGGTEAQSGRAARVALQSITEANLVALDRIAEVAERDRAPASELVRAASALQAEVIERAARPPR